MRSCSFRALAVLACCVACGAAGPKTGRDWSKLSDKDWDRISDEWETEEEKQEYEYKPPEKKGVDMEALKKAKGKKLKARGGPRGRTRDTHRVARLSHAVCVRPLSQKLVADSQVSSGPTMMFATVDYAGCCTKKETEEIGTRWASMLRSSGMDIATYVIEDNQVLFSSQTGLHAGEIRDYVVTQPECVAVEWNNNRTPGPAETKEWKKKDEALKAEKEATRKKKDEEEAAVKKAEQKAKAKAKKRRAAKKKSAKDEV